MSINKINKDNSILNAIFAIFIFFMFLLWRYHLECQSYEYVKKLFTPRQNFVLLQDISQSLGILALLLIILLDKKLLSFIFSAILMCAATFLDSSFSYSLSLLIILIWLIKYVFERETDLKSNAVYISVYNIFIVLSVVVSAIVIKNNLLTLNFTDSKLKVKTVLISLGIAAALDIFVIILAKLEKNKLFFIIYSAVLSLVFIENAYAAIRHILFMNANVPLEREINGNVYVYAFLCVAVIVAAALKIKKEKISIDKS